MLMGQKQIIPYDFKENREKIENMLTELEYSRRFNYIICVNMEYLYLYKESILSEMTFFNSKESLFVFYEKIEEGKKYDVDKQVSFLKENGFLCTTNCLCVGVPFPQLVEDAFKDSLKKANFII